ncbi:hypothetical protein KDL21_14325 [Pseudomonas syringae pv. syringae]|uniref:hypothetical protein n=1 Tax=Pseudomonas syringae TaxID=317 RepID=UPI00234134C3|nr:hypothetical protein [Pseudomonas syringae]MDC3742209.1 hypothetical protein [Pseudomonas syringae pv. syringae]
MRDRRHDEAVVKLFQAVPFCTAELFDEVCRDGDLDEMAILARQLSAGGALKYAGSDDLVS